MLLTLETLATPLVAADATTIALVVVVALILGIVIYVMRGKEGQEDTDTTPAAALPAAEKVVEVSAAAEEKAAEPKAAEPQPKAEPEPKAAEPEPKAAEPEPKAAEPEPKAAEPEPKAAEPEPKAAEPEPKAAAPQKEVEPTPEPAPKPEPQKSLREGLGKTRKEGFIARLSSVFRSKKIDASIVDDVEEVLFTSDIGVQTAEKLLDTVRDGLGKNELKDAAKVWSVLKAEAHQMLSAAAAGKAPGTPPAGEPTVTMVLGVNGAGKTTSIGKIANQLVTEGKTVHLIAGDTFRAAAAEQLEVWGRRVGATVFRGKEGADPASVVFDGVREAVEAGADHVLVDTAGRLHTQVNLMEELRKVRRVMGKAIEGAPHEVLMVLDATTGQNAIEQAKQFNEATDVTGIILTKLDGTAKGGVVIGVCDQLGIPIKLIGIGERVADLRPFIPEEFIEALFGDAEG